MIETEKRIEHKIYFRVDDDALERLLASGPVAKKPRKARASKSKKPLPPTGKSPLPEMVKVHSGESEKSTSGSGESPSREMDKDESANRENPSPPTGQNLVRGAGEVHLVNVGVTTTETTAATRASADAVDNSAAAAADSKNIKPDTEGELTDLLIGLERERGKDLSIDRSRDRVHVLKWVADGVTVAQLRKAHESAVAARKRESDGRPTYVGFVATFVDQLLAADNAPQGGAVATDPAEWHLTEEGVIARAAELNVRPCKPDEDWHYYRVIVVKAAKDRRAAEFVLADATRFNSLDLYQFARRTFGDALMPVDDYAS
ncbi:hypothetical protein [Paraburkholderia piptadeniae]|uniref:hypothetical protein n=1 Tax=Paraburkholderia piptadeniae TaxID=1701573 RepID=UPI00117BED88|nr:hypothetical protein [Paraburkholderia piptadeniae]